MEIYSNVVKIKKSYINVKPEVENTFIYSPWSKNVVDDKEILSKSDKLPGARSYKLKEFR